MEFLVVSNVVLWLVVIVQCVLIFALTRQLGVLFERVAPAGALSMNKTVKVGEPAKAMSLPTVSSGIAKVGTPEAGKSQLLMFVSPDCPVCKTLMPAIKSSAKAESDWIEVIFASDGDDMDHEGYIRNQGIKDYPYIVSELLGKTYGVSKLPYAVLIDDAGNIASMGIINSREHLESLFEAKELNVPSIQEYMQGSQNTNDTHSAEKELAYEAK